MRIGVDIDGVLADFNTSYIRKVIEVTGKDMFGDAVGRSDFPGMWDYPQAFGYSAVEVGAVWKHIERDELFWATLSPLPGATEAVRRLDQARLDGHDVYFLTARPGRYAKFQTECWLMDHGMVAPTVIITSDKAGFVKLLGIDAYIDDRLRNANDVMTAVRLGRLLTRVYLKDAPYNQRPVVELKQEQYGVVGEEERDPALLVVNDVGEFLTAEGL